MILHKVLTYTLVALNLFLIAELIAKFYSVEFVGIEYVATNFGLEAPALLVQNIMDQFNQVNIFGLIQAKKSKPKPSAAKAMCQAFIVNVFQGYKWQTLGFSLFGFTYCCYYQLTDTERASRLREERILRLRKLHRSALNKDEKVFSNILNITHIFIWNARYGEPRRSHSLPRKYRQEASQYAGNMSSSSSKDLARPSLKRVQEFFNPLYRPEVDRGNNRHQNNDYHSQRAVVDGTSNARTRKHACISRTGRRKIP